MARYPERIVTLAAEIPGILAELSALDRVVGISAYTTYPPKALNKPKVSGFRHGSVERILAVKPDVVILTSTVQAPLAQRLGEQGATVVHVHPHRLADLFDTVRLMGVLVGEAAKAEQLIYRLQGDLDDVRQKGRRLSRPPRTYFEEWMDPLIVGIGWISDLIELAGGIDVFRARSLAGRVAPDRVISLEEWAKGEFDIMLASWCGRPFDKNEVEQRPGAEAIAAIHQGRVYEVDASVLECGVRVVDHARMFLKYFEEMQ